MTICLGRAAPSAGEVTYSARSSSATASTTGLAPAVGVCKTRRLEGFGSNWWSLLAYSVATCVSFTSMRAPRSPPDPCASTLGVLTTRSPRCQDKETVDTPAGRPRTSHTCTLNTNLLSVFPMRRIARIARALLPGCPLRCRRTIVSAGQNPADDMNTWMIKV